MAKQDAQNSTLKSNIKQGTVSGCMTWSATVNTCKFGYNCIAIYMWLSLWKPSMLAYYTLLHKKVYKDLFCW